MTIFENPVSMIQTAMEVARADVLRRVESDHSFAYMLFDRSCDLDENPTWDTELNPRYTGFDAAVDEQISARTLMGHVGSIALMGTPQAPNPGPRQNDL